MCINNKSPAIPQQLYKTASRSLSAIAELLVLKHTVHVSVGKVLLYTNSIHSFGNELQLL